MKPRARGAPAMLAAAWVGCWASTADAREALGRASDADLPVWRLVIAFILCIIVAIMAALALRRFMRGGGASPAHSGGPRWFGGRNWLAGAPREIAIQETHRASLHGDICLINWGERQFLVAISPGGVTLLDSRPAPQKPDLP